VGGGAEVGAENGVLRGAWRRQAVPAPGLPQGSCYRWRAALHCAWRRQAVPARGLLQVRSRRHGALYIAHGGGRRCQHAGCLKSAQTGGTPHCQAHGGGKRCQKEGCSKAVARAPGSVYCTLCLQREQPDDA
jgi:hypothetical protein